MAVCKYCASGIEWEKDEDEDKWRALNEDGSRHWCDRSKAKPYFYDKGRKSYGYGQAVPPAIADQVIVPRVGYREYTIANPPEFPRNDVQAGILEVLHRIEDLLAQLLEARRERDGT